VELRRELDCSVVVVVGGARLGEGVLSRTKHSLVVQSKKERAVRRTSGALQAEQVSVEHAEQLALLFPPSADPRNFEQTLFEQ
jgi:hypothetical protein